MGRPLTPTNVLERRGAFKRNPKRGKQRAAEPKAAPLVSGRAPSGFSTEQKKRWRFILDNAPAGVVTQADVGIVQMCAVLWEKLDRLGSEFAPADATKLMQCWSALGMHPGERARLRAD